MPEETKQPTEIQLTRGGVEMLINILTSRDWTKKRRETVAAGKLSERLEPSVEERPVYVGAVNAQGTPTVAAEFQSFKIAVKSWEGEIVTFMVSDIEFQTCITCIKHYSDEGKIPGSIHGSTLLEQFKLTE